MNFNINTNYFKKKKKEYILIHKYMVTHPAGFLAAPVLEYHSSHQCFSDQIGVTVGCRPAVLQVPLPFLAALPRDAHAGPSVGHTAGELEVRGCLVVPRQTSLVVLPTLGVIQLDVAVMFLGQPLYGLLDLLNAAILTHGQGAGDETQVTRELINLKGRE